MGRLGIALSMICLLPLTTSSAEITLGGKNIVAFASLDEGRKILTARDEFVERMSPFDRAARMKTDQEVSEEKYLEFVRRQVVPWTEREKQQLRSALEGIQPTLQALRLSFPKTIYAVKTTGKEEGGAAYTRGNAIVFPEAKLLAKKETIQHLICHELFHILSRVNPELRKTLYETIGFTECKEIKFPANLMSRKITNPDAPRNDHYIRLRLRGEPVWAIPILFSRTEKYDVTRRGEFFDYLEFHFLIVKRNGDSPDVKPTYEGNLPRLVTTRQVTGFFEQIGRNTNYIIHPEEILADNFALLVLGTANVKSPEIVKKMREVLRQRRIIEPKAAAETVNDRP